jgi:hypothetical protein
MNKDNSIKEILGMNYDNMAMLLQISRSQWGMYVSGKRNLPLDAKLKLGEMLSFVNQKESKEINCLEIEKNQNLELEKYLDSQQLLNTELQLLTSKKLITTSRKYDAALKSIHFINFLESKTIQPTKETIDLWQVIKKNAETQMQKNSLLVQTKLQIKIASLQYEKKVIIQKMNKG